MASALQQYTSQFNNQQALPEFDLQRSRLKSTLNDQANTQRDALERKLAQLQGGPSGAGIKLQQQLESDIGKQAEQGMEGIDSQELAARRQLDEAQKQREYQTSERLGGQEFAGGQAAKQREFATGERLGGQDFAGSQSALQRQFAEGERLGTQQFQTGERASSQQFAGGEAEKQRSFQQGQFDADLAFKKKIEGFTESSKLRELNMAENQFKLDQQTTEFNKMLSIHATGDWRVQKAGLEAMLKDPNTTAGSKAAAQILYNTYGYNTPKQWGNK